MELRALGCDVPPPSTREFSASPHARSRESIGGAMLGARLQQQCSQSAQIQLAHDFLFRQPSDSDDDIDFPVLETLTLVRFIELAVLASG
jgi:hypothetical protein